MTITPLTLSRFACFAVLGALTARQASTDVPVVVLGAAAAVGASLFAQWLIVCLASAVNPDTVRAHGVEAVRSVVDRGFVMLVPFAVLSATAQLALHWGVTQAFVSAALMTSGGSIGMEIAGWGGRRTTTALATTASMFALSAAWMTLSAFAVRWV